MYNISLVVLTGLSGAGKSVAAKALEDLGYYTIDNLPMVLVDKFVEMIFDFNAEVLKVALVIDSRTKNQKKAFDLIKLLQEKYSAYVIFLESSDNILIRRYKETRRKHPLGDNLIESIKYERSLMMPLRDTSDVIIDTSNFNVHDLSKEIEKYFSDSDKNKIHITIQSFGFKYGVPPDSDMLFDVRFLKNPHFVEHLRNLTGKEKEVSEYVFSDKRAKQFLKKIKSILLFLLPNYIQEGKRLFTLSIGCTGGKHRSVAITEEIAKYIEKKYNKSVSIIHRDIDR
jgi:UPF0042 nucleotide-binding protein